MAEEQELMGWITQQASPGSLRGQSSAFALLSYVASPLRVQDKTLVQPCPADASLGDPRAGGGLPFALSGSLHGPGERWLHQMGCRSLVFSVVLCVERGFCASEVVA